MKELFLKVFHVYKNMIIETYKMVVCGMGFHFYEYGEKEFKGTDSFGRKYNPKLECRECKECKKLQIFRCYNGWCGYENF